MRALLISAVAATTLVAGCDQMGMNMGGGASDDAVVVADATGATPAVTVTPADANPAAMGDSPLPILGTWSCGTLGFTITPGTYRITNGASARIDSIDRLAVDDYRLTLGDAKKIRLSSVTADKLTYQHENSEASGSTETAACSRRM